MRLIAFAGVRAIGNFAPTNLDVPFGVVVRHEHISVGLGELLYHFEGRRGMNGARFL